MQALESRDVWGAYLDYLLDKVGYKGNELFRNVLTKLLMIEYIPYKGLDINRAGDGLALRKAFCLDRFVDYDTTAYYNFGDKCTVLEMMVALAVRMELDVAGDPSGDDRTPHWFDVMLESMGLTMYTGEHYNETEVMSIVWKMQNHEFSANGEGGLFKIPEGSGFDMRTLEIWSQMNAYITVTEG